MLKKVVILLPTYNEKGTIEKFVKEILGEEKNAPGWKFEILIVNDQRSNDGTSEIIQRLEENPKIHTLTVGPGLGAAIVEGHRYSIAHLKPDALAQIDADGQVSADVLPRLLKALDEGYNLALGSRFVKGGQNRLSPSRRIFSWGSSFVSRLIMGPWDIREFGNSARAFTPELFQKINFARLPWMEPTYIIMPSFVNEAVLAGAKYKELPLVFKNRAEGYSKNKIVNYTFDVLTYAIDARLHKWGINVPFFKWSRKSKLFLKFGTVGFIGTLVDFFFYKVFINFLGLPPATSKGFSSEAGIINNFLLNNAWTFRNRKVSTTTWQRFLIYNIISFGGLAIAVFIVKFLHILYGDGFISVLGRPIAYNNFYFFATIPPVMVWNFLMNHFITWRRREEKLV